MTAPISARAAQAERVHHQAAASCDNGRWRTRCSCGWRSGPCANPARAAGRWEVHALQEKLGQ